MHITRREPNHIDERGEIRDLITEDIDAVTYITCNKGAVRGNHYHEHTVQWEYVISGSLECYSRASAEAPIERTIIKKGDLVLHPIGEHHGFRALEDSVILSFTKGPRRGENYEQDVVRLKEPLFT